MVKMNKVLFTAKDMERCFKAGERFAKDINEPTMGEYILSIYKKREANGVDTSNKTALRKHAVISSFVCGHPPKQTYLNDGIWHCEKCGGKWKSIANK